MVERSQLPGARRLLPMLAAFGLATPVAAAPAESGYLELQGEDFAIVSAADERRTREIARKLLMFRAAMESVFGLRVNRATPTRIYALSARDWLHYGQPRPEVAGYFVAHPFASDLLFDVQAQDPRGYELMLHEYTHHVLRTLSSGRYPAFFDEGLAEVFSTAQLRDGVVHFEPRPEYVEYLRRRAWLPFERLLEIGRRDAEYVDHALSPAFYAQAWATMYYAVAADSAFGNRLLDYVRDQNSGVPRGEAVRALIGDTLEHANEEIRRFVLRRKPLPRAQIRVGGIVSAEAFEVHGVGDSERKLLLGELMIRLGNRTEAALEILGSVRGQESDLLRARVAQSLAHLQVGNRDAALDVLEAVDTPSDLAPATAIMLGRALLELSKNGAPALAKSDAERERLTRARALFESALTDERHWIEATHGYVLASLAADDHGASVVELAQKAYAAAPKNAELAVSLAILHELDGRRDVARQYWTDATRHLHEGPARTRILRELALQDSSAQR